MLILSQNEGWSGFHGRIGKPTNMYDACDNQLFIGDVVGFITKDSDGNPEWNYGIDFVCEEDTRIVSWTGLNHSFVMGLAGTFNEEQFRTLENLDPEYEKFKKIYDRITGEWFVQRVKSYEDLVVGEKIGFLYVREVSDEPDSKPPTREVF